MVPIKLWCLGTMAPFYWVNMEISGTIGTIACNSLFLKWKKRVFGWQKGGRSSHFWSNRPTFGHPSLVFVGFGAIFEKRGV
jgi:hypothetical protein